MNTEIIVSARNYRKGLINLQLEKLCPVNLYLLIFSLFLINFNNIL
jgi:hypothetical protein